MGAQCEYGDSPNPGCNQVFTCEMSGWAATGGTFCPTGTCPPTYADVSQNASCMPNGLDCAYTQGQCNCSFTLPVGGGPLWKCFTPAQGCPDPRPRLGSACTQPSTPACDYGACEGGIEEACSGGYWTEVAVPCPG